MDSTNPVLHGLLSHRSIRRFDQSHTIPQADIDAIIQAGQQASTSCTGQMYTIIEISKEKREEIKPLCGDQKFVSDASFFCVICVDLYRLHRLVEKAGADNPHWPLAGLQIGIYDAGLMGQNMALAAEALGYGICFCGSCADQPDLMIEALKLPEYVIPITGLAIGKSIEEPPIRPRIPQHMVHHIDEYKQYTDEELQQSIDHMSEKLDDEGYYLKYSKRENYQWKDHLVNKFGGKWLNIVEKRRAEALRKQKFLS